MWCVPTCIPRSNSVHVDAFDISEESARRAREEQEQANKQRQEDLQQLMAEEEEQEREEERLRQEKEEEAAWVAEEESRREEARRAFEMEQQRREQEEEARRKEAERLEQEQQQESKRQERQEAVKFFCRRYGFDGFNQPRRNGCTILGSSVTYPLHQAAELADERIVEMLLKEGASPMTKNGAKETAAQLAQKKNKGGSHDGVLQVLKTAAATAAAGGA